MTIIFAMLFVLSLLVNITLVWYVQKIVGNLRNGVKNIDELQELLEEYSSSLEEMSKLDEYYGDTTISGAVKNTKMVVEACKFYKNSVLEIEEEVKIDKEQNG